MTSQNEFMISVFFILHNIKPQSNTSVVYPGHFILQ